MPDLTHETAWVCRTNEYFQLSVGEPGGSPVYFTEFGITPEGPYRYGWSCGCPNFSENKTCKHVEVADLSRCKWNNSMDPGLPPEVFKGKKRCPICKGPVVSVTVAV